jgi:hypothetical protein
MSAHTPGPWHVSKGGAVGREIRADEGPFVASVYDTGMNYGERNANAQIIAAAPAMLNLLQRMHERLTDGRSLPEWAEAWAEEIQAYIAKAEGR